MLLLELMRKFLFVFLFIPFIGVAQVNSVSPYTLFGIGDLSEGYFVKNISMGGTGISLRDPIFINLSNPASYTSIELTTLELGVTHRFLRQKDLATNTEILNQSTFFHYFGMGVKLKDWWGMSVALTPYSKVGYNIFSEETVDDFGETKYIFKGNGGIDQLIIGTSFEVMKNLSLGVNLRYLFGSTDKSTAAEFENTTLYNSKRNTRTRVSDATFDFGIQYTSSYSEKYDLTFGATYGLGGNVKTYRSYVDYNYQLNSGIEVPVDTVSFTEDVKGTTVLPTKFGLGVSYGKKDENIYSHSWMISADFDNTAWSTYRNFDNLGGLEDSWRFSLGSYFIPGFAFNSKTGRRSYLSQIEWRVGGFYENTNLEIENTPVTVTGATLGWSFPFRPKNLAPGDAKLNNFSFGIVVGQKGAASDKIIKEEFINLTFGITLNDLWFQDRKYR